MPEITLAIVGDDGTILIDDTDKDLSADMQADLAGFGEPDGIACANPGPAIRQLPPAEARMSAASAVARIGGYWHSSTIDGPGLRSVVRFQGCPIRCAGCYVPETHDPNAGTDVAIDVLAGALLDPAYERDGVTIIGGEPFAQPAALRALVDELRRRDPALNVCVYSGFTLESLHHRSDPDVAAVLESIDILIDGPFVQALSDGAGPYTGSSNQRVRYFGSRRTHSD